MALIKCPECGRENVSDSAESCPECGYNIKKHFEDIKKAELMKIEEENRAKQEEERLKKEREKQEKKVKCPECGNEFLESLKTCPHCGLSLDDREALNKIYEIKYLENRANADNMNLLKYFGFAILSFLLIIIGIYWYIMERDSEIISLIATGLLFLLYSVIAIIKEVLNDSKAKKRAELAKTDYEAYLKERKESMKQLQESSKNQNVYQPKCPTCGSTNVRKIGTGKKTASIVGFGILSSNIGKTYECLNCKYKW